MELQGRLLSSFVVFLTSFLFLSCQKKVLPVFDADLITLRAKKGEYWFEKQPFSGALLKLEPSNKDTVYIQSYRKGKKDGIWKKFYPQNHLKESRVFKMGSKEGTHIGYYLNGQMHYNFQLKNDVYNGFKKEWLPSGDLIVFQNYINGYEQGPQQVWYPNGEVKNNYIVRNGRRYGLLGTKNCVNVKDSIF